MKLDYGRMIKPAGEGEYYSVSSAQKRLFVLNQLEDINISYNMPGAIMIEGELDQERLENVFKTLVDRHESLRTSFEMMMVILRSKLIRSKLPDSQDGIRITRFQLMRLVEGIC